jgi:hypothetical protein
MRLHTRIRAGGYNGGAYSAGGRGGGGGGGSSSFAMTASFATTLFEVGSSAVNPAMTFAYTNGSPASAQATQAGGAHSPYVAVSPFTSVTCNDTFTSNVNATAFVFNASAVSTLAATAAASATLTFGYGIVWGYSAAPAATQAQYNALLANFKSLSTTRAGSYNYAATTAAQYCMVAIPAAFGMPVVTSGAFTYVPALVGTAVVANAQGLNISTNFYVLGAQGAQALFSIS